MVDPILTKKLAEMADDIAKEWHKAGGGGIIRQHRMKHLRIVNATKETISFRLRYFSHTTLGFRWLPGEDQFTDWYTIGPEKSYIPKFGGQEHVMGMLALIEIHPSNEAFTGYKTKAIQLCIHPYSSPMLADYVFFLLKKGQKEPNALKTMWIITSNGRSD